MCFDGPVDVCERSPSNFYLIIYGHILFPILSFISVVKTLDLLILLVLVTESRKTLGC